MNLFYHSCHGILKYRPLRNEVNSYVGLLKTNINRTVLVRAIFSIYYLTRNFSVFSQRKKKENSQYCFDLS